MHLPELDDPEKPPLLGSWRNLYGAVLLWLAFLIVVFYGFTRFFHQA